MKKILSILSMLTVCLLMASCQTDADKAEKIFKEKNQAQLGNDLTRMKKQLKQLQDAEQALIDQINS